MEMRYMQEHKHSMDIPLCDFLRQKSLEYDRMNMP